jgi:DNA polymerase-3 subunit gamma/tau
MDLLDSLLAGDISGAITNLRDQYNLGGDPLFVLHDLLELIHWVTRLKVVPDLDETTVRTRADHERGSAMAAKASMAVLARAWQMLLKGLKEAQVAPNPLTATEMILVRLGYVADLPTPAELAQTLSAPSAKPDPAAASTGLLTSRSSGPMPALSVDATAPDLASPVTEIAETEPAPSTPKAHLRDFDAVVRLVKERGELSLYSDLVGAVHLVRFDSGTIELRVGDGAKKNMANHLSMKLTEWTGQRWVVALSNEPGVPTLSEREAAHKAQRLASAAKNPVVQAVLKTFPGAEIHNVREAGNPPDQDKE